MLLTFSGSRSLELERRQGYFGDMLAGYLYVSGPSVLLMSLSTTL